MSQIRNTAQGKTIVYVGTYGDEKNPGGIFAIEVAGAGELFVPIKRTHTPKLAGYLTYDAGTHTLYSVDERKNDGRGPVEPPASIMAFRVNLVSGVLTALNSHVAPGPRPTYLNLDRQNRRLACANHGDFDHVEKAIFKNGQWVSEYVYDDSTVIIFSLNDDGSIAGISDLVVLEGHGKDPNRSPQAGGHAQASPHAHSAVFSPDARFLLVCDKGTDRILVYAANAKLELVHSYQFAEETAPRHLEFASAERIYLTCEISSELASMRFDADTGEIELIDKVKTIANNFNDLNEPAEIRVHPSGEFIYVNNRGEDSLAWFSVSLDGTLKREGHVQLAKSIHPGLAARNFTFAPCGKYLVIADRPDNCIKSYSVNSQDGSLHHNATFNVPQPAFIEFVRLNN
ncbi:MULTISPECIES: beta-propeller fold lactonase family protein [unclassified Enterobacter]|jgi:6-phosphogluconolactonase|uniref:lactonase family protein n=1 Tax=unclassified Enterobacter TaxID=2608935 RepID=UPI0015CB671B|nr:MULTISPECIES: beta-propeller fold lactonase family protein [unclassified Enterobacter]MBB3303909.1 6-phosphogluconolactonase [Enterobacter sp. Sphag1F]NYI12986.1 6-phosphogluconolactonase [Enterobacter sp. Sphag71]